jgi:trehalose 6-phosphate phosphatase
MQALSLAQVVDRLTAAPEETAVCCDFDGTLAAIVDDPALARPVDGAVDALTALTDRFGVVAVLSGRPVAFLRRHLPDRLELRGLYGLEGVYGGVPADHPEARGWRDVVAAAVEECRRRCPPGVLVEPKGLSLTLHYRTAPEAGAAVLAAAEAVARRTGLELRPARMSVELHPPVAVDKGTCLRELAAGRSAACFVGDDAGDLTAFDALDDLASRGAATARVAVRSGESPPELLARADLVVDGPVGVVTLLRALDRPG